MVTRNLYCPNCGHSCVRTALCMAEPSYDCEFCDGTMITRPSFPAGVKFIGEGFHAVDYPKSFDQKVKDYGLERHDSTKDDSDYHEPGYDGS